jgi:hypothetical protein
MSKINDLVESFSFRDEIAKVTEIKDDLKAGIESVGLNRFDFIQDDEPTDEPIEEEKRSIPEPEEPYDAEQNASSLVYMLTAIDSVGLTFAVQGKCKMNAGGGKALKKMKVALSKEIAGEELTAHDKTLIAKFKEYKSNMQLLTGEVIPGQEEIDRMIRAAIPYCEETKLKIGAGFAFWTGYVGSVTQRLTKIFTA